MRVTGPSRKKVRDATLLARAAGPHPPDPFPEPTVALFQTKRLTDYSDCAG